MDYKSSICHLFLFLCQTLFEYNDLYREEVRDDSSNQIDKQWTGSVHVLVYVF